MPQPRSLAHTVGAAALGAALAVGVGWLFFEPRSGSPSAATSEADERLLVELRELRAAHESTTDVLARLELRLADDLQAPPSPVETRLAVDEPLPVESLADLVRSLDDLRATFARESLETRDLLRSTPAFGGESLVEIQERRVDNDWTALGALEEAWRADKSAANRSQYFQTERDLLRAYGPPSAIYRPKRGGLQFVYRAHPEGGTGPACYFQLQDGFVVEFFVEDEVAEAE